MIGHYPNCTTSCNWHGLSQVTRDHRGEVAQHDPHTRMHARTHARTHTTTTTTPSRPQPYTSTTHTIYTYRTPLHNHHTVQVAQRAHLYVCTLVNAWLVEENTTSASCSLRWQHGCKSCPCTLINALVGARKTPPVQVADDAHCKCM